MVEQRKKKRFTLKNNPLVIHSYKIGNIKNISLEGLCCSCLNDQFEPHSQNSIDIRCHRSSFHLQNIEIKIIQTEVEHSPLFSEFYMRKCHILFEKLTNEEIEKLAQFIADNSLAEYTTEKKIPEKADQPSDLNHSA